MITGLGGTPVFVAFQIWYNGLVPTRPVQTTDCRSNIARANFDPVPCASHPSHARGRSAGNKAGKQMHPSERQKARNTPKKGAHSRDHDGESSSGNPRVTKAAKTVDASGADFIAATRAACGMHGPAAGSMPVLSPCTRQSRS